MKVRVTDVTANMAKKNGKVVVSPFPKPTVYDDAEVALMDEQCALINHSDGSVSTYVRHDAGTWVNMEGNVYTIAERG
jgi:hypothetical protein